MTTTYSPDLRIALIGLGDQDGTWGTTTNTNLGTLIEQAIAGVSSTISISSTNQALTASNGIADEARNAVLVMSSVSAANVYVPPCDKVYIAKNAGAYNITMYCSTVLGNTTAAGTGITIPAGKTVLIYSDATNILEGLDRINGNLTVGGTLAVTGTSAFTGNITATANIAANNVTVTNQVAAATGVFTGAISSVSPTFTGTPTAPTAANGTSTTQIATTAFVNNTVTIATASLGTMSTQNSNSVTITGGTINSLTVTSLGTNSYGTKTVSTSSPTGGANGDIWYKY